MVVVESTDVEYAADVEHATVLNKIFVDAEAVAP